MELEFRDWYSHHRSVELLNNLVQVRKWKQQGLNSHVSVLKIDQSFVREMMGGSDDLSIISAVVGMAKAFGLQVIAEGVESTEQIEARL